jgi:hypothetical protein
MRNVRVLLELICITIAIVLAKVVWKLSTLVITMIGIATAIAYIAGVVDTLVVLNKLIKMRTESASGQTIDGKYTPRTEQSQ